ncbi:MAG: hypothetical protein GY830_00145 [Bacteroidetes bacterium]|nr:hypothetical protein [Bacteroidota bacterium]
MNYYIFGIGLSAIALFSLYLGIKSNSKSNKNNDFFLGGRNLGIISLTLTLLATQLGGGSMLGGSNAAIKAGPFALGYSLGQALGFIVLGLGIGSGLRKLNIVTTSEIFEKKYNSPILRKFTGLISIISLTGILIAMAVASKNFIRSIGFDNEFLFLGFWLVLIIYTVYGGFSAVVKTDIFQAIVLMFILTLTFAYSMYANPGILTKVICDFSWTDSINFSKNKFLGWILLPFLFTFVEQDIGQRCFAAKTPKIANISNILAAALLILFAMIPVFFGMAANTFKIPFEGNPFMNSIINLTNPVISGLAGCAVLAAIISTADSILIAITSNICQDFTFFRSRNNTYLAKIITSIVCLIAIGTSYLSDSIFSILVKSYEISVYCMIIPVLFSIFDNKNKYSSSYCAWGSVIFGLIGFFLFRVVSSPFGKEISSIILSLIGYILGYLLNKKLISIK